MQTMHATEGPWTAELRTSQARRVVRHLGSRGGHEGTTAAGAAAGWVMVIQ